MHASFHTHLDDVPQCSRGTGIARASLRLALLEETRALAAHIDAEARSLLDPTLLDGASIQAVETHPGRISIDLSIHATSENADGHLPWGGPMRLIAEGKPEVLCSDPDVERPDPADAVIWSELRQRSSGFGAGIEFVILCASDRRWRVRAKSIRFATLPIPS